MLVELFALPGAGKTSIVAAAAERTQVTTRKDLSALWGENPSLQRALHIGRAFTSLPLLSAAARFAFGVRITTTESVFRLVRLLAKRDWVRSQSGVILLDQGFLQDLWSILAAGNSSDVNPRLLSPLIRHLYRGVEAKIVVIDVDASTAASRVRGREKGHSRFDGLPETELQSSLASANELLWRIIEAAKLAGLEICTVDGSRPQDLLTDELLSLLPDKSAATKAGVERLPSRISIVGSTGSGKSHLARRLAGQLGLPVHELDELRRPDTGSDLPRHSFQDRVAELVSNDGWIIDGHYRDVRRLIWSSADLVVWLNYPLTVIARRLYGRFRGKRRPSEPGNHHPGNERSGASWTARLKRLARTLGERREYGRLLRSPDYPDLTIVELRSTAETERWLRSL